MAARKTVIKKIIVGRPLRNVDVAAVGNASQLASNSPSYYLDYDNFTNTPNVLDSADVTLIAQANSTDSAQVSAIVDSAYINARLDTTSFLDSAEAIALIDSAYILARASNIQNLRDSGSDTIITGALLPATDSAQDLGSPTRKFKDLYLSGNTLYIGGVAIGTDSDNNVQIFQLDGNGEIQATQGKVALVDSAEPTQDVRSIIDSDYINLRLDTTLFLDSNEVITLVDSNYVAARTFSQADIETFARAVSLDSAETINLIDSAYVLARSVQNLRDSGGNLVISGSIVPDADSAYSLGSPDRKFTELYLSGNTIFLAGNSISVDSANDFRIKNSAGLLTNLVADHLHLGTDKKKISVDANDQLQFSTDDLVTNYGFNLAANSITDLSDVDSGAVTGEFLQWNGTQFAPFDIDSAYVAARTWTQAEIEAFASNVLLDSAEAARMIDSAVNALVDGAPGALDTLNELAAALNDDSDAYGSLVTLINTKLSSTDFDTRFDSALGTKTTDDLAEGTNNLYYTDDRVSTLIDSAYITARASTFDSSDAINLIDSDYIQSRQTSGTDSAEVEAIAAALVDSNYIASRQSSDNLTLGNVTDGSLTDGALQTLTPDTKIVDAIDELNEAMLNVSNNTFVRAVTFSGSPLAGGEGVTVSLSITPTGNANRYDIDWGDGTIDSAQTTTTPSHTYPSNSGSPFTVSVRAFNNAGTGSGSTASFERTGYVIVYTADPVANYNVYAAASGGSPITFWQDGDTVYFENTTTNTTMADVTYRWTWGDGSANDDVDSDNAAGGVTGPRIAHTFALSTETDVQRSPQVEILTHTTADPSVISAGVDYNDTFEILDSHSPSLSLTGDAFGVNAEATSGLPKTFTNTSEAGIGSYSTYGNQYRWTWGDGSANETINAGSGSSGDRNVSINHTFALPDSDQTNGHVREYDTNLSLLSNHISSPFVSSNQTIKVVPEVRAIIDGSRAIVRSNATGDTDLTIYNFVDYNGNDRRGVRLRNRSQHGNIEQVYNWGDGNSDSAVQNTYVDHIFDSADISIGNVTSTLNISGDLGDGDVGVQTDTDTVVWDYKEPPTAPDDLSVGNALTWNNPTDAAVGLSPRLANGVSSVTWSGGGSAYLVPGTKLNTSTAIRMHSGASINPATNKLVGTSSASVTAKVNGTDQGQISIPPMGIGTSSSLIPNDNTSAITSNVRLRITSDKDYYYVDNTYPARFYRVFTGGHVGINSASGSVVDRLNAAYLEMSAYWPDGYATKESNKVHYLRDQISATMGISTSDNLSWRLGDSDASIKYIGGQAYYSAGNIRIIQPEAYHVTTAAYVDADDIITVDRQGNLEGTTGAGFNQTTFGYTDILDDDDITTYTVDGVAEEVPTARLGRNSVYQLKDLYIPFNSNVRTVEQNPRVKGKNCNGESSYTNLTGNLNPTDGYRIYTASTIAGLDETDITSTVPNKNGNGVRVTGFASTSSDTPSYTGSTNFYTDNAISHTSAHNFQGTQEAGVSINGVIQHDTTDYSDFKPTGNPDRSGDTGNQYFTFAFRSTALQNFNINLTTSTGISGLYIALPGTGIDTSSTLNGWLDCSSIYNGSGQPGAGTGGNGSNGCAFSGETVPTGSAISNQSYSMTFGTLSAAGSTGNNVLVRVVLASGETVSDISVSQFA